jgi:DNA-binding response OmpR family regulator
MGKKRILIIDDEADFTKLLKLNLELTGQYEVRTENNGLLGLAAAKEFKPDLILLDIAIPGMDGYEVASGIRDNSALDSISIIFMTGKELDSRGIQERVSKLGAYGYISKPCDFQDILANIKEAV